MRALLIASGIVLWVNAFACRQELWEAWASASAKIDAALHAPDAMLVIQGIVAGVLTILAASPTWKVVAGGLFLKVSIDTHAERSPTVRQRAV